MLHFEKSVFPLKASLPTVFINPLLYEIFRINLSYSQSPEPHGLSRSHHFCLKLERASAEEDATLPLRSFPVAVVVFFLLSDSMF